MNKVKFGLKNVWVAPLTEKYDAITNKYTYTYDAPFAIKGAVNLSTSAVGDTNDMYADDVIYYSNSANQGYEGDFEMALVPEDFETKILGFTKDSNGAIIENSNAKSRAFALGFEVTGDSKGRKTWFYNCTAARPSMNAQTKESGATPQTDTLSLKFMPRLGDNAVKAVLTENETNKSVFDSFFSKVYESNSEV